MCVCVYVLSSLSCRKLARLAAEISLGLKSDRARAARSNKWAEICWPDRAERSRVESGSVSRNSFGSASWIFHLASFRARAMSQLHALVVVVVADVALGIGCG